MTTIKLFRLLHAVSYLLVASQLLFFLAVFIQALKGLPIEGFIEHRKAVELIIAERLKYVYYICLALSVLLVFVSLKDKDPLFMITAIISLVCLLIDVLLAIKGNIPINTTINTMNFDNSGINWELLRDQWLNFFKYRGWAIVVGTLSLLVGFLFNKKI